MNISVLQWNIWYLEKVENVAHFLQDNKADIICLQELSINSAEQSVKDTVKYVAEQLGYEYFHEEVILEDQEMNLANAIFSRFPIKKTKKCWINEPTGTGHYDDQYRAYVEVTVGVEDSELTIGTVHMSYTDAFRATPRKLLETKNLARQTNDKTKNYILTGDFNAEPGSEVIKLISSSLTNAGPDLDQNTWTTKPFLYGGFEAKTLDWRLDYIFTSPDIKVSSAKILETDFSDHLPIVAFFDIAG